MRENEKRIKYATVISYAKRLEKEYVRRYGDSYSFSTLAYSVSAYISEIESDSGYVRMRDGWRQAIKRKADLYISATQ